LESNETKLKKLVARFQILSDWKVEYDADSQYKGQCCKNEKTKTATVYAWYPEEDEPIDYLLHEVLHIAIAQVIIAINMKVMKLLERKKNF